uniref:Putative secreted protein n=1 Tax=Anopheles darlingi TaxID=43151 RepID=A0A2M4DJS4_ANODA
MWIIFISSAARFGPVLDAVMGRPPPDTLIVQSRNVGSSSTQVPDWKMMPHIVCAVSDGRLSMMYSRMSMFLITIFSQLAGVRMFSVWHVEAAC